MHLTEEQKQTGRRNFLKAVAGVPALAALGVAAAARGPVPGGAVKAAVIGTGGMGRGLINQCQKEFIDLRALAEINPKRRKDVADRMVKAGWPQPKEYDDWKEMLQKEDIEAVIIATPLWNHADITVGCLDAGKHVLCEKMMAKTEPEMRRMAEAAQRNNKVLEIGYQRYYNPIYQSAYENIIKAGTLGEVYHAQLAWHRNGNWRRSEEPPAPGFDPSRFGFPDWEHLLNWRLYKQYSEGLIAELGSHQITATSWFFDSAPETAFATGGINRFKDREVFDHVYAIFEYPGGRTATFSSIESNAFGDAYEMYKGTKGTLILTKEIEAYLFSEGDAPAATRVETSPQTPGPVADASATRPAESQGRTVDRPDGGQQVDRSVSYKNEIAEFCSAVRTGTPLRCGPEKAMRSAVTVLTANRSAEQKMKLDVPKI